MPQDNLNDLLALLAVARERSFTRAAATMGLSPSSLSHKVRGLEMRMGVQLLTRTTRSVSPTEAGERLLESVAPEFEAIAAELEGLRDLQDMPAGKVRITAVDSAVDTFIWPRLAPVLARYPSISVDIDTSHRLVDIVAERFDFGVRSGDAVAKDMVAVRIAPDFRRVIVGSPAYFERHPVPLTPQDLLEHNCIRLRLSSHGGLYHWPLVRGGREQSVKVQGQLIANGSYQVLQGALNGVGLAFSPEYIAGPHIEAGRLRSVLDDWSPTTAGFHLYYPSRRQMSRASSLVLDALRLRRAAA